MTFSGTVANVNAAMDGLTFAPSANYNGPATVQIVTNDLGNTGIGGALSDTDTVNITVNAVNDAPVITAPATGATNEDTALVFSVGNGNAISVADLDVNEGTGILQLTLERQPRAAHAQRRHRSELHRRRRHADATMTFTGTLASINAALNGLTFNPTLNYNGGAALNVSVNDQGNTGSGGTLSDSTSVALTINPINDAPVLAGANDLTSNQRRRYDQLRHPRVRPDRRAGERSRCGPAGGHRGDRGR
jgi:hypothetical protein